MNIVSDDRKLEQPAISAVIPTYNRARLVVRAVESVLHQTVKPAEIIIVDDGSTDETRRLLSDYGDLISYVYQENKGSATARNKGMQLAESEWIALLDSDDEWNSHYLEQMASAIHATEGRAKYYFADTHITLANGFVSAWQLQDFVVSDEFELVEDGTGWLLASQRLVFLPSTIVNRQAFWDHGGFIDGMRYRDDTHLFMKLGIGKPICAVNTIGALVHFDDAPGARLTDQNEGREYGTRMQVIMFEDLLRNASSYPPETLAFLTNRLGKAHLGMARYALRDKHYLAALLHASNSLRVDPLRFFERMSVKSRSITRRFWR